MGSPKNVFVVCSSNKDRSPALAEYLVSVFPKHKYRSAGINEYFCKKNGTHLLNEFDIAWSDLIVFCEDVHFNVVHRKFSGKVVDSSVFSPMGTVEYGNELGKKQYIVLNCGRYEKGCIGEDYITRAHVMLERVLLFDGEKGKV